MDDNTKNRSTNYKNGLQVRTEVMGEPHVKRSLDAATGFTQPLQDWIIENAWGSTWQAVHQHLSNLRDTSAIIDGAANVSF